MGGPWARGVWGPLAFSGGCTVTNVCDESVQREKKGFLGSELWRCSDLHARLAPLLWVCGHTRSWPRAEEEEEELGSHSPESMEQGLEDIASAFTLSQSSTL